MTLDPTLSTASGDFPGWRQTPTRLLGERQLWGSPHAKHGQAPQLAGVRLPDGDDAVLIANQLSDIRLYRLDGREVPLRHGPNRRPLGYANSSIPEIHRYVSPIPHADGWDLLCCGGIWSQLDRLNWDGMPDGTVYLAEAQGLGRQEGLPAYLRWEDESEWLVMGHPDGRLTLAPLADPAAQRDLICGGHPVDLQGRLAPQVIDGRDLLVGDGHGQVWQFRADRDADTPRYDAGRRLVDRQGFVQVDGPASPALVGDALLVADGGGTVHQWSVDRVQAWECVDLPLAAGVACEHAPGRWWRLAGEPNLLCAGPAELPAAATRRIEPTRFEAPAPELAIDLPPVGLAEVHLTLQPDAEQRWPTIIRVRLSDETQGEWLACGENPGAYESVYFKASDLTGRRLCLSQLTGAMRHEGGLPLRLAGMRLIPLAADSVTTADTPRRFPVPMGGILDTIILVKNYELDTEEQIDELVALHKRAGLDTLYVKAGGSSWEYPSRYPDARGVAPHLPGYSDDDRAYCEKQNELLERVNRVKMIADACKRHDLRCIGWMRWQDASEHTSSRTNLDRFFVDNQHLCDEDIYGNRSNKLCLAYPEVQDYFCRIAEEVMSFGMDGLLMDTLRKLPKVMYAEPIRRDFEARYGLDMCTLSPFDTRVVAHQCEVHTRFMRAMAATVRSVKPTAEIHMRIGAAQPLMGVDPAGLAREGLVDTFLIAHRSRRPHEPDVASTQAALAGTGARVYACVSRTTSFLDRQGPLQPGLVDRLNSEFMAAAVDGITYYETKNLMYFPELRRAVSRFSLPGDLPSRAF